MNPIREVVRALDRRRAADRSPSVQGYVASGGWSNPAESAQLSNATPLVDSGSGSAGTGTAASRYDHVHPSGLATALPLPADGFGSVGAGTLAAREDHIHPATEDRYYADVGGRVLGTLSSGAAADMVMIQRNGTITKAMMRVLTAPTGADLICDLHLNGTSIWASTQAARLTIGDSTYFDSEDSFDTATVTEGDTLQLDIDQVGSGAAGANLTWAVQISPTLDILGAASFASKNTLAAAGTRVVEGVADFKSVMWTAMTATVSTG